MIRLAAALVLLCSPALAEVTVTIVEPDATGYIGQIVHHNRWERGLFGEEMLRFETDRDVSHPLDNYREPALHPRLPRHHRNMAVAFRCRPGID